MPITSSHEFIVTTITLHSNHSSEDKGSKANIAANDPITRTAVAMRGTYCGIGGGSDDPTLSM